MSNLPLIVGYGGINAGGRSIFDFSHHRMVFDDLNLKQQKEVLQSLGHLMGTNKKEKIFNLDVKSCKEKLIVSMSIFEVIKTFNLLELQWLRI